MEPDVDIDLLATATKLGPRLTEHVIYCTGIWDADTIIRQAAEAPMVRP